MRCHLRFALSPSMMDAFSRILLSQRILLSKSMPDISVTASYTDANAFEFNATLFNPFFAAFYTNF